MRRWITTALIMVFLAMAFAGCASGRKYQTELKGLMLQDNLQMKKNRTAYYSKHNVRLKREANRLYRRNNRNL